MSAELVYGIRTDRIRITRPDRRAEALAGRMLEDSTVFSAGEPDTATVSELVECPVCAASGDLALRGSWGGLDAVVCLAGRA
ncbi:hypothetical protein PZB75_30180 [Streptomyces sp. AM 4-1-1]|uniref:hypothetical protein n=1 Tax=Streptomyces sp. AM 4-1-1 TaxID=3028710 RepID=UPI0023BA01E3|nr:hypothetical protein [Streptomyces sp. AM 4-1-1]WEH37259.1 hypothetical protein PZB75_30180 [Streptomyces sp. AM 4-1-1]